METQRTGLGPTFDWCVVIVTCNYQPIRVGIEVKADTTGVRGTLTDNLIDTMPL
jgi:hypothetical protein